MTNVSAKLIGLSTPAKIILAIAVAVVLGVVGYLVLGPTAGGLAGVGGLVSTIGSIFRRKPRLSDGVAELARENTRRIEREQTASREAAAVESADRAAARGSTAVDRARASGAADDGDPRLVLDRQRRPR